MKTLIEQYEDRSNPYHGSAQRTAVWLRKEATITAGVIRWDSNKRVPPQDCVELAKHLGLRVDVAACARAREDDVARVVGRYREAQARRTPEQVAEQRAMARAAHGPGAEMVNVITGERYRT